MMTEGIRERVASFEVTRAWDDDEDRTRLEGYAAVFNEPTVIATRMGEFQEQIAPGAFKRTIDQKGPRGIRLQFDHGRHALIGQIPLGVIDEIVEDQRGLFVRATLTENWLIQPVRDAIRDGAVSGMSFRFRVIRESVDSDQDPELRMVEEVELYEVGPVVWPAYEQTTVGVRAREVASALMDPQQRREVAAALLAGTSPEPADGTSDEPADVDDSLSGTRRTVKEARQTLRRIDERIGGFKR